MMRTRLAGLMFVLVVAMSSMTATAASAGLYLFSPSSVGVSFSGSGLALKLLMGINEIFCADGRSAGTIANIRLIRPFTITFLNCESKVNETACKANSVGAAEGVILTKTLHAVLGAMLPSLLGGLLVLPASGDEFIKVASSKCRLEGTYYGDLAALLVENQLGHSVTETLVDFIDSDGALIDTVNGRVTTFFEELGIPVTVETVEHLAWDEAIEIEV
jgi:hypothetical protein